MRSYRPGISKARRLVILEPYLVVATVGYYKVPSCALTLGVVIVVATAGYSVGYLAGHCSLGPVLGL